MPQARPKMRHIDDHVHCRDWGEKSKATIRGVMQLARSQGIVAIGDMANTSWLDESTGKVIPYPIINAQRVEERLQLAAWQGVNEGYYMHVGATSDVEQMREAFGLATHHPKVIGVKDVFGITTGPISMPEEYEQKLLVREIKRSDFEGVLVIHAELERFAKPELWDPTNPASWNRAKPPEMEVDAVRRFIGLAAFHNIKAHIHIAHASVPETVKLVWEAKGWYVKANGEPNISCGVTPHHLTISTEDMQTTDGIQFKVNPPIRDISSVKKMMEYLSRGWIDNIETDHAPHTLDEKTYSPEKPKKYYMSGIRSMDKYSAFLDSLWLNGFTSEQIYALTYANVKRIFPKITE
jgi:dihydroorotase